MTTKITIEFDVVPTDSNLPLALTVVLDGESVWQNNAVTETCKVSFTVDDAEGKHVLRWHVSGKLPSYTKIDADGNIVSDSLLKIENFIIDDIDISNLIYVVATYTHDCNGTAEMKTYKMYEELGCNGVAELKFTTPLYLWLLESM